jgi:hypothetical protein
LVGEFASLLGSAIGFWIVQVEREEACCLAGEKVLRKWRESGFSVLLGNNTFSIPRFGKQKEENFWVMVFIGQVNSAWGR